MGFLSIFIEEHQYLDSPFDLLPDDVIHIIFNKVQDAKALLACFSLNKRLAFFIPQIDVVSLSLNLPAKKIDKNNENSNRRRRNNENSTNGNFINIARSAANYLITKLQRNNNNNHCDDDGDYEPAFILCQRLRPFNQIRHLHLELRNDVSEMHYEIFKWNANYDREFKSFDILFCEVLFRHFSAGEWLPEPEQDMHYINGEQELYFLASCLKAALERHRMVKEMLPFFPTLETVTITDVMRQGRFFMAEKDIQDLRDSLMEQPVEEVEPPGLVTRKWCAMRRWHSQLLELSSLRCTWKDAVMLVVDPVDGGDFLFGPGVDPVHSDPPMVPTVKVDGGCDSYKSDRERAMFEEARREILTLSEGVNQTWRWVTRDMLKHYL